MTGAVVKVEPVGTKRVGGMRCMRNGSVVTSWDEPVYPPYPDGVALRRARVAARMGLQEATKRLGLSAEIVCGLEHGRYRFVDGDDWARARDAIASDR